MKNTKRENAEPSTDDVLREINEKLGFIKFVSEVVLGAIIGFGGLFAAHFIVTIFKSFYP